MRHLLYQNRAEFKDIVRATARYVLDAAYRHTAAAGSLHASKVQAMADQLVEMLDTARFDDQMSPCEKTHIQAPRVTHIGNLALDFADMLQALAQEADLHHAASPLAQLRIASACWVARHGGQIQQLEPVVDALAAEANETDHTAWLAELAECMTEIMRAVDPSIIGSASDSEQANPWRLLNINAGIVATRSHNPQLMETSFEQLVHRFPDDAGQFFVEGMAQVKALNFPSHVKAVMQRYYKRYSERLH